MTDQQLWNAWLMWLGVAVVVIIAAAALLLAIYNRAQRILTLAVAALGLVKQIKTNTLPVWSLEATNNTAGKILGNAQAIRDVGGALAHALHDADVTHGRAK
jgi:hypothetical protein